jgi:hypothetical protein
MGAKRVAQLTKVPPPLWEPGRANPGPPVRLISAPPTDSPSPPETQPRSLLAGFGPGSDINGALILR